MNDDVRIAPEAFYFLEECRTRVWISDSKDVLRNCKKYIQELPESEIRDDLELLLELAGDQMVELAEDYELPTGDIYEILEQ